MKLNAVLLCFILYQPIIYSQEPRFGIKYLGANNGLTSGNIRKIAQDHYGFLWVATQDGLFRYDSKTFISYNTQFSEERRISGPDVRDIQIDSVNNLIWLSSSYGGLDAIDLLTSKVIKHISQTTNPLLNNNLIKTFSLCGKEALLGCEKGLFRLNLTTDLLSPVLLPGISPGKEIYVDLITEFKKDYLLILCRNLGGFVYSIFGNKVIQQLTLPPATFSSSPLQFYNCAVNKDSLVYITSSQGIFLYKWRGTTLIKDVDNPLFPKLKSPDNFTVRRILSDQQGMLWLASNKGLLKYDGKNLLPIQNADDRNENNDWLNAIYSMYVDKSNDLWLGCQNGLAYLKNSSPAFISHSYSAASRTNINHSYYLFPLNDSIIYSAAEEGLYKINRKINTIELVEKGKTYDFLFLDPFNRLIISNIDGLFVLYGNEKKLISSVYPEFKSLEKLRINSSIKINDSCLILGTENSNGVIIWDYKSKKTDNITTKSAGVKLFENTVNNVCLLTKNRFLILSDASLSLFDYNYKTVTKIDIRSKRKNELLNIYFDLCRIKDTLYLACYGNGVFKLNNKFEVIGEISTFTGLGNNGVYKVIPWKDSLIFITTNNGLASYSLHDGIIKHFYKEDGLHNNAFEESSGNVFGEEIFAGGTNGFTSIYPKKIHSNKNPPIIYLGNVTIEKSKKRISDTVNLFLKEILIPNDAFQVTVYFPCINYKSPEKTFFQYKIEELQKNWTTLKTQNFITLIGLSPGTYHLQVQAFNEDGVPSEIKELTLIFLPKWYQTWWFKLLLALLAMSGIYGLYYIRIRQLKKEQQIRTRLASDLHDDLGSTMNSVKIYASLAIIEKQEKYLLKIKESTQEAITGIKDMIWILDDKKDSIEHLLSRVGLFASPLCEANNIHYKSEMTDDARDHKLGQEEKRNLYMMLKEAVNNAVKYSEGQKIEIGVSVKKKKPEIWIKDDGAGFDTEKANEGNGLKNMLRRAREIKYLFEVESGTGTTIHFRKI